MDTFELYPSHKRLVAAILLGAGMLYAGQWMWRLFSTQSDGPSLAWAFPAAFLVIGALLVLRAVIALVKPKPCFMGNAKGYSVMGKPLRPWSEIASVSVRTLSVNFVPSARWVTIQLKPQKGKKGPGKRLDIPWTHLPSSAYETAHAIEQLVELARSQRAAAPATYDPYDPAALHLARARTV